MRKWGTKAFRGRKKENEKPEMGEKEAESRKGGQKKKEARRGYEEQMGFPFSKKSHRFPFVKHLNLKNSTHFV